MTIPQTILRELVEKLARFDPPPFGKVKIDVEMNYADGQMKHGQVAAYDVETVKG